MVLYLVLVDYSITPVIDYWNHFKINQLSPQVLINGKEMNHHQPYNKMAMLHRSSSTTP
jgi:hypothetical protein